MFMPTKEQLHGFSLEHAELYGKPHLGAHYEHFDVKSHKIDIPYCDICGRPSTNVHHMARLSWGRCFDLRTPIGIFTLLPSLIALCGSGTTGCHGKFHSGRASVRWVWKDDLAAKAWWDGELLRMFRAHSPSLFGFGYYVVEVDGKEMVLDG